MSGLNNILGILISLLAHIIESLDMKGSFTS